MQKEEWKFEYTAAKVAEAARVKTAGHNERLEFWKKKREEIIATIRSEGIEVDEKVALAYSNPKARDWDNGGEILIRNDLRKVLAECFKKLAYHTELRDSFDGWRQFLQAHPTPISTPIAFNQFSPCNMAHNSSKNAAHCGMEIHNQEKGQGI